jgi:hypothetical protein
MTEPAIAQVGDWIEEPSTDGSPPRRGLVVDVLGGEGHRHYRVRWDEEHESIHFPSPQMRVRVAHGT